MAIGRIPEPGTGIPESIVDAKGDLVTATAADTPARLAVGSNEQRLVADSAAATGLKYVADTTNYAIAAKGDLLVGTAADTLQALSVGTNGHTLVADSTTTTGLKWAAPAAGGTYTTWTPTFQNFTLGNGTVTARYCEVGNFVNGSMQITLGSTSSVSGVLKIELPTTREANGEGSFAGLISYVDTGTGSFVGFANLGQGDFGSGKAQINCQVIDTAEIWGPAQNQTATRPHTWANTDRFRIQFSYEKG